MGQQKPEDWARWRTLLSEQQQSGQSIAAFCRARGLREGPFYEWRKRLQQAEASSFVAVEIAGAPTPEALPVCRAGVKSRILRAGSGFWY